MQGSLYGESLDESGSTWAAFTVIKRSRESLVKLKKEKSGCLLHFSPQGGILVGVRKLVWLICMQIISHKIMTLSK